MIMMMMILRIFSLSVHVKITCLEDILLSNAEINHSHFPS